MLIANMVSRVDLGLCQISAMELFYEFFSNLNNMLSTGCCTLIEIHVKKMRSLAQYVMKKGLSVSS